MGPVIESWLKATEVAAYEEIMDNAPLYQVKERFTRIILRTVPYVNDREKTFLLNGAVNYWRKGKNSKLLGEELARYLTTMFCSKPLEHIANVMDKRLQVKAKAVVVSSVLDSSRRAIKIFFLSSYHQKPAEKHKQYQGKIFVDRYWKNTLRQNGLEMLIPRVEKYIREHNTLTVQEILGAPVYFITRPYCRHFFVPLDLDEVLENSPEAIFRSHVEARTGGHRSLTDAQRYTVYVNRRRNIRKRMIKGSY